MADESDFQLQNSAKAIDFAREAIRSGILINGGAAVAVLALLSGEGATARFDPSSIWCALISFAFGVLAAYIACPIAYVAQTLFAAHNAARIAGKETSDCAAICLSAAGVILIVISILSFTAGVFLSARGFVSGSP